jgi:hypothetical protein
MEGLSHTALAIDTIAALLGLQRLYLLTQSQLQGLDFIIDWAASRC